MKPESVSFIGAGNLAWHIAPALDNTGFAVREIFSAKEKNASALASRLYQCEVKTDLDFSTSLSKIFILAVSDDAIEHVVKKIKLPDEVMLIHTSGSKPLSILETASGMYTGVFYPLQTFTKNRKLNIEEIPICIESEDAATEKKLTAMAKAVGKKAINISSDDRKVLHMAAVFAANFTNHMLTLSKEILHQQGLSFDYLKPLIAETLNKSLDIGPEHAQTGPARRGDLEVLDAHMALLKKDEAVAEIYRIISQHIVTSYNEGE